MANRAFAHLLAVARLVLRAVPDELFGARIRHAAYRRVMADSRQFFAVSADVLITGFGSISIGGGTAIDRAVKLHAHESRGLRIGSCVGIGYNVVVSAADGGAVRIGDNVMVGPNVVLVAADHRFDDAATPMRFQGHVGRDIEIGDDVWIAANCVVVGGVSIGRGSVIGAGAVVTRDVPPMEVWGGVPARFVARRAPGVAATGAKP